jgi:hypothetical protein
VAGLFCRRQALPKTTRSKPESCRNPNGAAATLAPLRPQRQAHLAHRDLFCIGSPWQFAEGLSALATVASGTGLRFQAYIAQLVHRRFCPASQRAVVPKYQLDRKSTSRSGARCRSCCDGERQQSGAANCLERCARANRHHHRRPPISRAVGYRYSTSVARPRRSRLVSTMRKR